MRVAIIKNGIVDNVCEADADWITAQSDECIESEIAGTGDIWDGIKFTRPPERVPTNEELNEQILKQLAENDLKIIRALVENDQPRIVAHRAAQAELRARLK